MKTIDQIINFDSKNLGKLLEAIPGSRLIGGCVRDHLLGLESRDIDIATTLRPEEVVEALTHHKIKAIPTGIDFGTVTAVIDGESFEITSLRKDIDCDGRHAVVEYTDDFAEDAARRDFTINALSYCPSEHRIYDYYGGLEDLKAKRVKFIGDPKERIREDHLRILRFFRFSARYASVLDQPGYNACVVMKDSLKTLPRERINLELDKLLVAPKAIFVLEAMLKTEIDIMDGLEVDASFSADGLNLYSIYAMLLRKNSTSQLKSTLPYFRFSRRKVYEILDLSGFIQDAHNRPTHRLFELWVDGKDVMQYLLIAERLDVIRPRDFQALKEKFKLSPPKFPLNGGDLRSRFSGSEVGVKLTALKRKWILSDFAMTKDQLLDLL
jgi:poly(A) polymerase